MWSIAPDFGADRADNQIDTKREIENRLKRNESGWRQGSMTTHGLEH